MLVLVGVGQEPLREDDLRSSDLAGLPRSPGRFVAPRLDRQKIFFVSG